MHSCYKHKKADCKEPCVWIVGKGCKEGSKAKTPVPEVPAAKLTGKFDLELFSDCYDKFDSRKREWNKERNACVKAMLDNLKNLKPGANVNVKFPQSTTTPLYAAIVMQIPELVKALIAAGANVNKGFPHEPKPIHAAAGGESLEILKILIDAGANVNAPGDGETALELACMSMKPVIIDELARKGAKMYPEGESVAMHVIRKRGDNELKIQCLKVLVNNGLDVNYKMTRGKTFTIIDKVPKKGPVYAYLQML